MKGITEERLRKLAKQYKSGSPSYYHILRLLKTECTELNPWQPIDTAPKDSRILSFVDGMLDLLNGVKQVMFQCMDSV